MSLFCCPVCGGALSENESGLRCARGHCFDRARAGYVNLLMSNRSHSKRHGDDKRMLHARRIFLDSGCYAAQREALTALAVRYVTPNGVLADVGCGEGYYTAALASALPHMRRCGVDISKDALALAAKRCDAELAVASAFSLPLANNAVDLLTCIFAPTATAEFARVLRRGGTLIRAVPTVRHLFGLKAAVYEHPRENLPEQTALDGFTLTEQRTVSGALKLDDPMLIEALFEMTPYFYKTSAADQQKLRERRTLESEIGFCFLCYRRE